MVAIHDGPHVFTKLFGLNLLYELLNKSDSANAIKAIYNFHSVNFIQLTAAHDIFSNERLAQLEAELVEQNQTLAERDGQLASLNQALAERDGQLASLNRALADLNFKITRLISSNSWRFFGRLLRGELKAAIEGGQNHGGQRTLPEDRRHGACRCGETSP